MQRSPAEIMKDVHKVERALSKDKPLSARELATKTGLDRAVVVYSLDRLHVVRHGDTKAAAYTKEKDGVKPPVQRLDIAKRKKAARKSKGKK